MELDAADKVLFNDIVIVLKVEDNNDLNKSQHGLEKINLILGSQTKCDAVS